MAKSFDDLVARATTPQVRAKAKALTRKYLAQMLIREIRMLAGKSQTELARILGVKQPGLSKLEQQDDMQVSTLKKIVEALGGEVHIIARFPKADVEISQFEKRAGRKPKKILRELRELQVV
jgi:transcriptional regulator with XRE-family HTH domain